MIPISQLVHVARPSGKRGDGIARHALLDDHIVFIEGSSRIRYPDLARTHWRRWIPDCIPTRFGEEPCSFNRSRQECI